jgi:hypothetical protein
MRKTRIGSRNAAIAVVLCLGAIIAAVVAVAPRFPVLEAQSASSQGRLQPDQSITFEIRGSARTAGKSDDQITILFSNNSADLREAPRPLFGKDILAEFSFSSRDARDSDRFVFQRVVRDLSFLDARFIRVVNHGDNGWAGDSISILLGDPSVKGSDVRRIIYEQSMYPRRGYSRDGLLQNFNRANWMQRTYWEAELQRIRVDRVSPSAPSNLRIP